MLIEKKSSDLIRNRTRDLTVCGIVPQLTTPPRAAENNENLMKYTGSLSILPKGAAKQCLSAAVRP
jgi:hypothetical protein